MSKLLSSNQRSTESGLKPEADRCETGGFQPPRLITKAELRRMVPYTPQHILRLEKRGLFPRRVQVGPNRVAWLLSEIEEWIAARVSERDVASS
jgi:prophage regulatory protein